MTTLQSTRTLPTLALVAGLAGSAVFLLQDRLPAASTPPVRDHARALSQAFRDVARTLSPSVVGVLATKKAEGLTRFHGAPFESPLEDRFFRFFGEGLPDGFSIQPPGPARGQGSGVIVDADGIIATNNHVVAGATALEVTLQDGRRLAAEVVGTDPETDLALLRVRAEGLQAAKLGDSKALEPGDWVVAIGNPFGLDHSVTVGVVSATGRSGIGVANYENFIQTDAAINPGNSGGPLVNLDGEVIGINTAIRSSNGGSDGISFAIPSKTLADVLPKLVNAGRVSRGWLGVNLQPLTKELAKSFELEETRGALINQVVPGTPADRAGLRSGDIVLEVNGTAVADPRALSEAIAALEPGSTARLGLLRDGEERDLEVELGERPSQAARLDPREPRELERNAFGLALGDLSPSMAKELDLPGGALVREVRPDSPAAAAGLEPGDVILSVGKHDVDSGSEAARLLAEAGSGARLLVASRDGSTRWLFLERREQ
jgi:serine protease Do